MTSHTPLSRAGRLLALGAVGVLGFGLAGCSSDSGSTSSKPSATTILGGGSTSVSDTGGAPTGLPTFEIDAEMPYKFTFPEATAPSGYVTVKLVNKDTEMAHQVQLVKLREGVTLDTFKADLTGPVGEGAMMKDGTPEGGPNAVGPGQSDSSIVDLTPGATYAVICNIPAPDGKAHYLHGMIASFTVDTQPGVTKAPVAKSTIKLVDFAFTGANDVNWKQPIEVSNMGKQPHELVILGPAKGKTLQDVHDALFAKPGTTTGPPPYVTYGGVGAIAPGTSQVFQPAVPAGDYYVVCFVGNSEPPHLPHFMSGMITQIKVS